MSGSPSSFGRAFCAEVALVAALVGPAGCSRSAPAVRTDVSDAGAARGLDEEAVDASADLRDDGGAPGAASDGGGDVTRGGAEATDAREDDALAAYTTRAPLSGKSIGHTSVVYKLRLEGGLEAAFKPRSRRGGARYRGEIAAHRLGVALGLDNVRPALPRTFDAAALRAALAGDALFEGEVVSGADGKVVGAIIPWIKGLEFLDLEKDPWLARWQGWLARGGTVPGDQRSVARGISTMVVFDYVTGNWDRWSGGNVGFDKTHGTVLFIDNDGAFYEAPPAAALARQLALLKRVDRFSRSFVAALRTVDVGRALGDEGPGTPLLAPKIVASVDARRRGALAIIDAKIAAEGEPATLAFE